MGGVVSVTGQALSWSFGQEFKEFPRALDTLDNPAVMQFVFTVSPVHRVYPIERERERVQCNTAFSAASCFRGQADSPVQYLTDSVIGAVI